MNFLPAMGFANPFVLAGLLALPVIWWLLRFTPPRPRRQAFPPTRILAELMRRDETRARSPLWLTILRMAIAALVILAMAGRKFMRRLPWERNGSAARAGQAGIPRRAGRCGGR